MSARELTEEITNAVYDMCRARNRVRRAVAAAVMSGEVTVEEAREEVRYSAWGVELPAGPWCLVEAEGLACLLAAGHQGSHQLW